MLRQILPKNPQVRTLPTENLCAHLAPIVRSPFAPEFCAMIMQRPDSDDDSFFLADSPVDGVQRSLDAGVVPGLLYRGVPQDQSRRLIRIDSVSKYVSLFNGPAWLQSRRAQREYSMSELYFG